MGAPATVGNSPPLPDDPLGVRFCQYFNHPWNFIVAPVPQPGEPTQWRTVTNYPLQPRNLWKRYNDPNSLIGLRFGKETRYALIDIDRGSPYHPENDPNQFQLVIQSFEDIGLCRFSIIQSSESCGLHIYFFLPEPVPSFGLACALKSALQDKGLQLKQGELEIFPNVKGYKKGSPSNYNAHRLPLQSGSWLLDEYCWPITNDLTFFLDSADTAASRQDMEALENAIASATQNQKRVYHPASSNRAQEWKEHLEERLSQGWTGPNQTNELLKDFVCYGIVWQRLGGSELLDYVVKAATTSPGYSQYCSHQNEIEKRAAEWVRATENNKFYTPYWSIPLREATYRETYGNVPNANIANNVVPFNRLNEERSAQAQERIIQAIAYLEAQGTLPEKATARTQAIIAAAKQLTGVTISNKTLHKKNYLPLWHPKHRKEGCKLNDLEQVLADSHESALPQNDSLGEVIQALEASPLGNSSKNPTPPPYMKVVCECSDPDAPKGHQGSADLNKGGSRGDFAVSTGVGDSSAVIGNQALVEDEVPATTEPTTEPTTEVASDPPRDLWRITEIRLKATNKAVQEVKRQAIANRRILSFEEQKRHQDIIKMQYLWQSGESSLVAEVLAWVEKTPGVQMTSSGPALVELVDQVHSPPPSDPSVELAPNTSTLRTHSDLVEAEPDYSEYLGSHIDPSWFTQPDADQSDTDALTSTPTQLHYGDESSLDYSEQYSTCDDQMLQVGDRVIWDNCPAHCASCNPWIITAINGDFAKLNLFNKPVPLSELRRAT